MCADASRVLTDRHAEIDAHETVRLEAGSLALQGLVTREYHRATGVFNAFYAAGMVLGPPISSRLFKAYGGATMLFHLAAIWGLFVLFSIVFFRDDPAAQRAARPAPSGALD